MKQAAVLRRLPCCPAPVSYQGYRVTELRMRTCAVFTPHGCACGCAALPHLTRGRFLGLVGVCTLPPCTLLQEKMLILEKNRPRPLPCVHTPLPPKTLRENVAAPRCATVCCAVLRCAALRCGAVLYALHQKQHGACALWPVPCLPSPLLHVRALRERVAAVCVWVGGFRPLPYLLPSRPASRC